MRRTVFQTRDGDSSSSSSESSLEDESSSEGEEQEDSSEQESSDEGDEASSTSEEPDGDNELESSEDEGPSSDGDDVDYDDSDSSDDEDDGPTKKSPPGTLIASATPKMKFELGADLLKSSLHSRGRVRGTISRSVSFSDDSTVHSIPRVDPSNKPDLFYTKKDLRRFELEQKAEKQAELSKTLEEMMAQASILMSGTL